MKSMEILPLNNLTRQELLLIWLRRAGLTHADVAKALGVGNASVARWISAETIPTRRHQQLMDFGVPAELLPEPMDITPGPKPAGKSALLAAAH